MQRCRRVRLGVAFMVSFGGSVTHMGRAAGFRCGVSSIVSPWVPVMRIQ